MYLEFVSLFYKSHTVRMVLQYFHMSTIDMSEQRRKVIKDELGVFGT